MMPWIMFGLVIVSLYGCYRYRLAKLDKLFAEFDEALADWYKWYHAHPEHDFYRHEDGRKIVERLITAIVELPLYDSATQQKRTRMVSIFQAMLQPPPPTSAAIN